MPQKRNRRQPDKRKVDNEQTDTANETHGGNEFDTRQDQGVNQDQSADTSRKSLLILPNELLLQVSEMTGLRRDVVALARSCRRLHMLLNWKIYREDAQSSFPKALWWAVRNSRPDTVLLSLQAGADVHKTYRRGGPLLTRRYGWICLDESEPEEVMTLLHEAVDTRFPQKSRREKQVPMKEHKKRMQQHNRVMQLLIDHGIDINAEGAHKGTALREALWRGDNDSVKLLLGNGAILNGFGPMHLAAHRCNGVSIDLIIAKGAEVDEMGVGDCTPLFTAADQANDSATTVLIRAGANVRAKSSKNWTPLHAAADSSSRREHSLRTIVQMLIRHGTEVDAQTDSGKTALYLAIAKHHVLMVECLLEAGANPDFRQPDGQTAMHILASNPNEEIRRLLLQRNAKFTLKDGCGRTPLHIACQNFRRYDQGNYCHNAVLCENKRENIKTEAARQNIIYWLLEQGVSDAQDDQGRTPLHLAVVENDKRMIPALARRSKDCNHLDNDGNAPLHLAVIERTVDTIGYLIENGADGETKDSKGNTPLHMQRQKQSTAVQS